MPVCSSPCPPRHFFTVLNLTLLWLSLLWGCPGCLPVLVFHPLALRGSDGKLVRQVSNPTGVFEIHEKSVSNGDHSFTAQHDGKYVYCFGNQHWNSNTKEVSFNVHGIVYVSESEMPSDPLEAEGECLSPPTPPCPACRHVGLILPCCLLMAAPAPPSLVLCQICSPSPLRAPVAGQRRANVYCHARAHPPEHGREHQCPGQVVESVCHWRRHRRVHLPGLVATSLLRGQACCIVACRGRRKGSGGVKKVVRDW